MERINFEDSPSENTPLSAFVLNKMQDNMQDGIKELEQELKEQSYKIVLKETITQNEDFEVPATYIVGSDHMEIYIEGILLLKDRDYIEVGEEEQMSSKIQFTYGNVKEGYTIVQKVKGPSIKVYYLEEEAINAVIMHWTEIYGNIEDVYIRFERQDNEKNYVITVSDNTTTRVLAFYTVNRYTLEITGGI